MSFRAPVYENAKYFKMSHSYDWNLSITVISYTYVVASATDWTIYGTDLRMCHEIRLISSTFLTMISVYLNKLSLILNRNLPKGELLVIYIELLPLIVNKRQWKDRDDKIYPHVGSTLFKATATFSNRYWTNGLWGVRRQIFI